MALVIVMSGYDALCPSKFILCKVQGSILVESVVEVR